MRVKVTKLRESSNKKNGKKVFKSSSTIKNSKVHEHAVHKPVPGKDEKGGKGGKGGK